MPKPDRFPYPTPTACALVLEDDPPSRDLLQSQLEVLGYDSDTAATGKEAYALWQTKLHSIVLTDCNLPGMSGFELAAAIRRADKKMKSPTLIVAITAHPVQHIAEQCHASGIDFTLTKPVLLENLREIFERRVPHGAVKAPRAMPNRGMAESHKAPIDRILVGNLIGDDPARCKRLFSALVKGLQANIGLLDEAYANHSISDLSSAAHRLRSSALAVGAHELARLCRDLEIAGRNNHWHSLLRMRPALKHAVNEVTNYVTDQFCRE